jgi:hypothetical protein
MSRYVHSCTHLAETPQPPPSPRRPAFGLVYESASKDRRHLFVNSLPFPIIFLTYLMLKEKLTRKKRKQERAQQAEPHIVQVSLSHRLNKKLDLQSLFGLHVT